MGGTIAATFATGASITEAAANVEFQSIYSNPRPGQSFAHGLTFTYWAGEDSWLSYLDWINPGELIALGGDLGRYIDRELEKEFLSTVATIFKGGKPIVTYQFDEAGSLTSVSYWEGGNITSTIDADTFLKQLEDPVNLEKFFEEIEDVQIVDVPVSVERSSSPSHMTTRAIGAPDKEQHAGTHKTSTGQELWR